MSLTNDNAQTFKCAASVAPGLNNELFRFLRQFLKIIFKYRSQIAVTDWTLYDSIYTERYMGLPFESDNKESYDKARMMEYVDNIAIKNSSKNSEQLFSYKSKSMSLLLDNVTSYLIAHGTLDDNVHFQQGMLLARVLERKDIQFKEIVSF